MKESFDPVGESNVIYNEASISHTSKVYNQK